MLTKQNLFGQNDRLRRDPPRPGFTPGMTAPTSRRCGVRRAQRCEHAHAGPRDGGRA